MAEKSRLIWSRSGKRCPSARRENVPYVTPRNSNRSCPSEKNLPSTRTRAPSSDRSEGATNEGRSTSVIGQKLTGRAGLSRSPPDGDVEPTHPSARRGCIKSPLDDFLS